MPRKVQIPVRFKEQLLARFDAKNAVKTSMHFEINILCPLCEEFRCNCACLFECPFVSGEKTPLITTRKPNECFSWISEIIAIDNFPILLASNIILWSKNDDAESRVILAKILDIANNPDLIEWVEG